MMLLHVLVLVGSFCQTSAWSGSAMIKSRVLLFSASSHRCSLPLRGHRSIARSSISMEWSPEEKARRAELARLREEKIIKERAERQRRLQEYDQDVSQQRSSTPTNFEPAGEFVMPEGNYGDKAQGLFGWANNNPSSKNAIYDLEFINSKAGGGNVGEMMTELRGKGRTEESREVLVPGAMKSGRCVPHADHPSLVSSVLGSPRHNARLRGVSKGHAHLLPRDGSATGGGGAQAGSRHGARRAGSQVLHKPISLCRRAEEDRKENWLAGNDWLGGGLAERRAWLPSSSSLSPFTARGWSYGAMMNACLQLPGIACFCPEFAGGCSWLAACNFRPACNCLQLPACGCLPTIVCLQLPACNCLSTIGCLQLANN